MANGFPQSSSEGGTNPQDVLATDWILKGADLCHTIFQNQRKHSPLLSLMEFHFLARSRTAKFFAIPHQSSGYDYMYTSMFGAVAGSVWQTCSVVPCHNGPSLMPGNCGLDEGCRIGLTSCCILWPVHSRLTSPDFSQTCQNKRPSIKYIMSGTCMHFRLDGSDFGHGYSSFIVENAILQSYHCMSRRASPNRWDGE